MVDSVKEIVIAIFCSSAVCTFIQFLINRWDQKRGLEKKFDDFANDFGAYKAIQARTHILRFSDELRNNLYHSKDYFAQTILDIDVYEAYCRDHPEFSNGLTVMASEYIKDEYKKQYLSKEENSK